MGSERFFVPLTCACFFDLCKFLSLIEVLGDFSLSRALPTPFFNSLNLARSFPCDVAISLVWSQVRCADDNSAENGG
jgi:hypothetical protein